MGEKKGKALALELMDDLLNEKSAVHVSKEGEANKTVDLDDDTEASDEAVDIQPPLAQTEEIAHDHMEPASSPENPPDLFTATNGDRTHRIPTMEHAAQPAMPPPKEGKQSAQPRAAKLERTSVGRFGAFRAGMPANATEAALAQSESLRVAQARLLELDQEIERLRLQNEQLAAAGETLRRRSDELLAANQKRESDYQNAVSNFRQEKEILVSAKEAIQREMAVLRQKNDELELRISTNIQKIRVRERELENRLELVKMESAALIRSKDELILDLKRQIDQLNLELNNYRSKNQELNRQTNDKQEMLRRTVKALRLALSMLEGEEEAVKAAQPPSPQRKAK